MKIEERLGQALAGGAHLRRISLFETARNTKSPTPNGVGFFVALLNLIYISIDAFENTKAKNTLSCNGFRVLNYAQSGLFCVRTKFISR